LLLILRSYCQTTFRTTSFVAKWRLLLVKFRGFFVHRIAVYHAYACKTINLTKKVSQLAVKSFQKVSQDLEYCCKYLVSYHERKKVSLKNRGYIHMSHICIYTPDSRYIHNAGMIPDIYCNPMTLAVYSVPDDRHQTTFPSVWWL
jgi:hypothetical protein